MKSLTVAAPLFFASILVSMSPLCHAADQGWQWTLTPYLWTSSIDGTVEANGREADVDVGFGDILDNVNFGFLGYAEATKGKFVLGSLAGIYKPLGGRRSGWAARRPAGRGSQFGHDHGRCVWRLPICACLGGIGRHPLHAV